MFYVLIPMLTIIFWTLVDLKQSNLDMGKS